jgi:nitric oxide reductase subunit C
MTRWGVEPGDHEGAFTALKGWMDAMPSGIEGRRQMPNFGLTDDEYRNLADFLLWTEHDPRAGLAAERRGLRRDAS